MTDKERIIQLIDQLPEWMLKDVYEILQGISIDKGTPVPEDTSISD